MADRPPNRHLRRDYACASPTIGTEPTAIQLRYLQTMVEVATGNTNTILFPVPVDLIKAILPRTPGS